MSPIDENIYEGQSEEVITESQVDLQPMSDGGGSANITATYTYRADGLRRSKTVNGETTTHIWDGANIVLELNTNGGVINAFTRDARGNLIRSTQHGFYLFNVRGDVMQRVNEQGNVIHTYRYTAFGVEQNPSANNTNPFRFAGEYYDIETGTIYLRARVFNPRTGRFTQADSYWGIHNMQNSVASILQAGNLYMYVMHNPVAFIDPTGFRAAILSYLAEREGLTYSVVSTTTGWGIFTRTAIHVEITYNGQTHSHRYHRVGDHLVVGSQWLMDNFGFSAARAAHQFGYDGDRFGSMDNAALAWGLRYWAEANRPVNQGGGEFGARMYRESLGRYFIGPHSVGTRTAVTLPPRNEDYHFVATIHTHHLVWLGLRGNPNTFSQADLTSTFWSSILWGTK
jgi:RHS repeat-associated protein